MCKLRPTLAVIVHCLIGFSFVLCAGFASTIAAEIEPASRRPVVVGYLPHYSLPAWSVNQIGPVTDIIYFADLLSADGKLKQHKISAAAVTKLQKIKHSTSCKLLLCVGGWQQSEGFRKIASNAELRAKFISDFLLLCEEKNFDGIDYDWEHPANAEELAAYGELLSETKKAFSRQGLLVTIAQAGWQDIGQRGYDAVDRVHLMSYDHDFPQATMKKSELDVQRLLEWGCPPQKIVLGIPFYGRDKNRHARSYADLIDGRDPLPESDQIKGYSLNNKQTVRAKVGFALRNKLGGIMIWELGHDTHDSARSLLGAITQELKHKN